MIFFNLNEYLPLIYSLDSYSFFDTKLSISKKRDQINSYKKYNLSRNQAKWSYQFQSLILFINLDLNYWSVFFI
jgi:hypothetical protein